MDTATAARGPADSYAIPIGTALTVAAPWTSGGSGTSGAAGATGTTGATGDTAAPEPGDPAAAAAPGSRAYLGVAVQDGVGGARVMGVMGGGAAWAAGLAAGDTVTAMDGRPVGSVADLLAVMGTLSAGQQVSVTWTDVTGRSRQATVTLTGPPVG